MAIVTLDDSSLSAIAGAIRGKLDVETTYLPSQMAAAIGSIETGTNLTSADEGKVVVEDAGSYVLAAQTSRSISQNGTYDTTTNDEVVVSVSGSSGVLSGSGIPSAQDGQDGDYYHQLTSIPSGIKFVDYLESSGTQYIDTGIYGSSLLGLEIEFDAIAESRVYGARETTSTDAFYLTLYAGYARVLDFSYGGNSYTVGIQYNTNDHIKVRIENAYISGTSVYAYGEISSGSRKDSKYIETKNQYTTTCPIILFGVNNDGEPTPLTNRIYRATFYRNGGSWGSTNGIIADFIPCLDDNDVPCMWDAVSETYVYNAGSGNFTYGSVLSTPPVPYGPEIWHKSGGTWQSLYRVQQQVNPLLLSVVPFNG